MYRVLNEELGFEINERELMRTRTKLGMLMRVPNGTKNTFEGIGKRGFQNISTDTDEQLQNLYGNFTQADFEADSIHQLVSAQVDQSSNASNPAKRTKTSMPQPNPLVVSRIGLPGMSARPRAPTPELEPEVIAKRAERLKQKQEQSEVLWAQKKRRRRTRDRAGLPADPPCAPRFPSETTIDEAKQFLHLDDNLYQQMRKDFTNICNELGIVKKTLAGQEGWKAAKDRLIHESPHLHHYCLLQPAPGGEGRELLAVDIICSDVTKRIRTLEKKMTIAEAKNAIGINPEESRQIRRAFYDILKADHFTSKLEAGEEHWKELKEKWVAGLPVLQEVLAPGDADPQHGLKVKAIEILCRDVMKRLRDDQAKRDPNRKQAAKESGPGTNTKTKTRSGPFTNTSTKIDSGMSALASRALATEPNISLGQHSPGINSLATHALDSGGNIAPHTVQQDTFADFQIDPELLANPTGPSLGINPPTHEQIPIYFRLSPQSPIQVNPKLWLATISRSSIKDLEALALARHPVPAAMKVSKIEGVIAREGENEIPFQLDSDDEVGAYLMYLDSLQGAKATFSVCFEAL